MSVLVPLVTRDENLRIRLSADQKSEIDDVLRKKKVSQQEGVTAILAWFAKQDGMLQSLILGQIDEEYELQAARMALERMAKPPVQRPDYGAPGLRIAAKDEGPALPGDEESHPEDEDEGPEEPPKRGKRPRK